MAPLIPALAQSESKLRFFERLGMDERNLAHARLYIAMKDEAAEGWKRLQATADTLSPGMREDGSVQHSETATHREILRIYHLARPETKAVYHLGLDETGSVEVENWIIRWMLWHVGRYRNSRSNVRTEGSPNESSSSNSGEVPTLATTTRYYDPVRDQTWTRDTDEAT
ncbi:hypothetical protein B0A48_05486 [Cryoendolithus antarcticus]|uniref:Uncharacterized protein n=1 Tax=Cryoendolithus antarcticus TaxID=1507870 RepID=A0A1V8TIN4_9PEZI|nr:hypothetical protein B0A48_05486 [Cryoendolithus antarcticus]